MQKSNAPTQYVIPWANTGTKNTIPVASQIGITNGAASFTDGYPPLTFTPIASGGVPPFGADTNGILYDETLNTLWQQSGFHYAFNSTFSTNQGGYPAQALLARSDGKGLWLNLTDNNTTNPDASSPSGWVSVRANMGSTTIPVVVGNNTPDPSTLGPRLLIVTGSIASTASLILPLTVGASWTIRNNTSGAGSLSVQGATGSGVTVAQGTTADVITDGTNFYTSTFNGAGVYLPINGTAVAATKLATARTIAMTGDVSWTSPAFDGTSNVTAAGTIASGAVTLAKMASFQANSLMGNPTGSTATPSAITLASPLTFSGTTLALSYTPVNRAGDTMTGALSVVGFTLAGPLNEADLIISSGGNNNYQTFIYNNTSSSSGGIAFTNSSGAFAGSVISWNRQTGATTLPQLTTFNSGVVINSSAVFSTSSGEFDLHVRSNNSSAYETWLYNSFTNTSAGIALTDASGNFAGAVMSWNRQTGVTSLGYSTTINGNLTVTGSGNFNTSDETLKSNIRRNVNAYDVHALIPLSEFHRNWDDAEGRGNIAQDAQKVDARFVNEYEHDGETKLALNETAIAREAGYWASGEVKLLKSRVDAMERFLVERLRY